MARTAYLRRQAYDNIAIGSAVSSQERIIDGSVAPARDQTTFVHGERLTGGGASGLERFVSGSATPGGERPGGA